MRASNNTYRMVLRYAVEFPYNHILGLQQSLELAHGLLQAGLGWLRGGLFILT